jgi:tetratricopeptide (TPR) repeat protein
MSVGHESATSALATGGAGTIYEYEVAAIALSMLLARSLMPRGRQQPVTFVGMQQRSFGNRLDDLVLRAEGPRGTVEMQIQVKRHLRAIASDADFRQTIVQGVQLIREHAAAVAEGTLRVGIAAPGEKSHLAHLTELAAAAQAHEEPQNLLRILAPGTAAKERRAAYAAIRAIVAEVDEANAIGLTHQLLRSLYIWEVDARLDGADTLRAIERLEGVALGVSGCELFEQVSWYAQTYGPRAMRASRAFLCAQLKDHFGTIVVETPVGNETGPPGQAGRQLPNLDLGFVGRDDELAQIHSIGAVGARASSPAANAKVCAIVGTPGIGKTSLAVTAAAQLEAEFPDGQLFVDLRGQDDTPRDPAEVIEFLLMSLDLDTKALPAHLDERAAVFRSHLAARRVLLVLDNANNLQQVQPLLPGGGRTLTLVTSRDQLTGLPGAHHLKLGLLGRAAAVQYLKESVPPECPARESELGRIAELCGYLPLALKMAAGRLASFTGRWSPEVLLHHLEAETDRIDELSTGELGVRASFNPSYRHLPVDLQRLFKIIAIIPDTYFSVGLVAAIASTQDRWTYKRLEQLVELNLVDRAREDGRYQIHDLLRLYAQERLNDEELVDEIADAEFRMLRYVLPTVREAGEALGDPSLRLDTGSTDPAPSVAASIVWLDSNWQLVRGVFSVLVRRQMAGDATRAVGVLTRYVEIRGLWTAWREIAAELFTIESQEGQPIDSRFLRMVAAVIESDCARQLRDTAGMVRSVTTLRTLLKHASVNMPTLSALNALGNTLRSLGRHDEAIAAFKQVQTKGKRLGDEHFVAIAVYNIGCVHRDLGRYELAITYMEQDITHCRKRGDRWSEAVALNAIGAAYSSLARHEEATSAHQQAYEIFAEFGDEQYMSNCLHDLGLAFVRKGDLIQALRCHSADLELSVARGSERDIAISLAAIAEIISDADTEVAGKYIERGLSVAKRIGDKDTEGSCYVTRGRIGIRDGRMQEGPSDIETGLQVLRHAHIPHRLAEHLHHTGAIDELPTPTRIAFVQEAIEIYTALENDTDRAQAEALMKRLLKADSAKTEPTSSDPELPDH